MRQRPSPHGWLWLAIVGAVICLVSVGASVSAQLYRVDAAPALGLSALHVSTIAAAMLRPRGAIAISVVAVCLLMLLADPQAGPWPWAVPWLLTQLIVVVVVAVRVSWGLGAVATAASLLGATAVAAFAGEDAGLGAVFSNQLLFGSLATVAVVVGRVGAELVETRDRLSHERQVSAEQQAQRELAEQKAQIARDLHDVIAHSMSLISVRAASASARLGGLEAPVAEEFAQIAGSARQALQEMRQVLTVLRPSDALPVHAPPPGLADIADLVAGARRAGHDVTLHDTGAAVDDLVGVAAYRIVQEALSNAARHAPGAAVTVTVGPADSRLRIVVANAAAAVAVARGGGEGLGVRGMQERARAVGGTLQAAPSPEGGYAVVASLPLASAPSEGADR